jgi:Ca2+-binding RTX toxin-like protein
VNAGDGNDTITSSGSGSTIAGGTGNDTITLNGASARVTDTGGDNFVTVAGSSATVTLGNGADTITITSTGLSANVDAGAGNNTVIGSINNDTITAGSGNDYISAGDGNNHITWTGGNDTIIGGSGIDTVQAIDSAVITKYYDRALEVVSHFSFTNGAVSISQLQAGNGTSVLSGIEKVLIGSTAQTSQTVLIVGAGGYTTLTAASAAATDGDIIYVADTALIANGSTIDTGINNISIVLSSGNDSVMMSLAEGQVGSVSIFGNRNFTINGTSDVDRIFDFTSITTGTNIINGYAGNDILVVRNATAASTIINGGAGADTLIGGHNDQLYGGDGGDTLLAYNGAAYLAGQAGNDVLFNAYQAVAVASNSGSAVVMLGGSGTDTFALIGNNTASGAAVTMNTTIADLSTGDKIDLSFLESVNNTLDIGGLGGKLSLPYRQDHL